MLEQARVFADLASAVSAAGHVLGFTGRRESGVPCLDVRDAAAEVAALAPDETAALVFGPETSGLTQDELALCGRRAVIPAHPDQPSLNLSHAVMIAGYEVFRARARVPPGPRRATSSEKEALLGLLRAGLGALEALPPDNPDAYFREWRALVQRADLTTARAAPSRAHGPQDGAGLSARMADEQRPFEDVRETADGFSIPELKWRELLFVGRPAARGRGVRARPLAAAAAVPGRRALSRGRAVHGGRRRGGASASAGSARYNSGAVLRPRL